MYQSVVQSKIARNVDFGVVLRVACIPSSSVRPKSSKSETEHPKKWDDAKVVAKTTVQVFPIPVNIETFTITFDDLTNNSALLGLMWEKAYVGIKIEVPTDAKAVKSIESVMSGPSGGDYFSAATYYHEAGKDLNKAKEWIDKAVAMDGDAFWVIRRQSLIYAKLGDKKGAIAAAKKSLAAAKKAGNNHYVKLNTASLKEWGAK